MGTLRVGLVVPAVVLLLAGCSADPAPSANPGNPDASAPTTTAATTPPLPTATLPPNSTPLDTSPVDLPEGPVQIDVLVGVDSGPERVEAVRVATAVTLNILNPEAADRYAIEGYGVDEQVPAGTTATIRFAADDPGRFEVVSVTTGDVLLVLEVL